MGIIPITDIRCEMVVQKVTKTETLEKSDTHAVTLTGTLGLVPRGTDNGLFMELVDVKLVLSNASQRDILRAAGIGDKGMMKRLVLIPAAQTSLEIFDAIEKL